MKPAFSPAPALALVCALALSALGSCRNPAGGGNETETPREMQFTITFDSDGGAEVPPLTGDEGSKIDKPGDPAREGYTFLGWYTGPEGGELFTAWPHTLAGDMTLYAQWHNKTESSIEWYTIIFDSAGGTEVSNIEVFEGSLVGKPGDPAREGYTFLGWFGEAEGGEAYTWPMVLNGDLNLYAHWLNKYTLSFDSAGGTEIPPLTSDEGSKIDKPEDPVREGYTFRGWYNAVEGGELYSWPHKLNEDLTLYAQWHDNTVAPIPEYTITFDSRGGTEIPDVKAFEGSFVGKPGDPEKEGYTFLGWFGEAEGGEAYIWSLELTEDMTIYAQWAVNKYTINFDSQGSVAVDALTLDYGTQLEEPAEPALEGYVFQGWYSAAKGGELYEWPHTVAGDLTLYARWTGISYTVEYDGNGGTESTASTSHVYGTESPLAENGFVRVGSYIFEGWNTQADGGGVNYNAGQPIINLTSEAGGKVTLYARWTDTTKPVYTISFDSCGGSAVDGITVNEGETLGEQPPDPTWDGYIFLGWYITPGNTDWVKYSWPNKLTGNVTIYARWALYDYKITYNLNGGSGAERNPVEFHVESEAITLTDDPVRDHYDFGGWYANEKLTGSAVSSIPQGSVGDKTFWAKWTPIAYKITYNLNGGSGAAGNPASYTVESAAITLAAPVRAGYTFGGWYDNAALTGSAVSSIPQKSTGNKSFYAKWVPVTYTITYNLDGGENAAENPASYTVESGAVTLADPSKIEHSFLGWYTNADLTGEAAASIPAGSTGNKTFWAKWTLRTYTITYAEVLSVTSIPEGAAEPVYKDGHYTGRFVSSYTFGTAVTLPDATERDYFFNGWYPAGDISGEPVVSIAAGTSGDIILYAKWTFGYYLHYNGNGGSGSVASAGTLERGKSTKLADNGFTRANYIFCGWNTKADGSGTYYKAGQDVVIQIMSYYYSITLYAQWLPADRTIDLSNPERLIGTTRITGNPLWQLFPERKEYVIYCEPTPSGSTVRVYVTGRTTENRIRLVSYWSRNKWDEAPAYTTSEAYQIKTWGDYDLDGVRVQGGTIIPRPRQLSPSAWGLYNKLIIEFVNAEIELPAEDARTRSALDMGPYHASWQNGAFEGPFYESLGRSPYNDQEVYVDAEFKGENKLTASGYPGITVWDSQGKGHEYMNEIPWQPASDSWTSWKTKHNLPHWEKYRAKSIVFAVKWGWVEDLDCWIGGNMIKNRQVQLNAMGWGQSNLNMKFSGGTLIVSKNGSGSETLTADTTLPAAGTAWGQRKVNDIPRTFGPPW
jgi:uncharacterized repeat protein (TIGR02543 family)